MLSFGNILWVILFGWIIALGYLVGGAIMYITWAGRPYARTCWMLAKFYLWPFGKFLMVTILLPLSFPPFSYVVMNNRGDQIRICNQNASLRAMNLRKKEPRWYLSSLNTLTRIIIVFPRNTTNPSGSRLRFLAVPSCTACGLS